MSMQNSIGLKNGKNKIYLMSTITSYLFLVLAVVLGTAANSFAKSAEGFTLLTPSILTAVTIVLCMYTLSLVMKVIPIGITYASFAGLCIIATVLVGIFKFNQTPNLYTIIGLGLIIMGVLMVNLIGKTNI
jgi:small multidrug resistance pump